MNPSLINHQFLFFFCIGSQKSPLGIPNLSLRKPLKEIPKKHVQHFILTEKCACRQSSTSVNLYTSGPWKVVKTKVIKFIDSRGYSTLLGLPQCGLLMVEYHTKSKKYLTISEILKCSTL